MRLLIMCFEDKAPKVGAYRVLRNKNWDMEDLIDMNKAILW